MNPQGALVMSMPMPITCTGCHADEDDEDAWRQAVDD